MKPIRALLNASEYLLSAACVLVLATMFALGIIDVFFRYVMQDSLSFPGELIRYLFVWSVSLGSALAVRKNSHAVIELFVNLLPDGIRRWVLMIAWLVTAFFFALLVLKGFDLTMRVSLHRSPAMRISMSYAYAAIPVGALFMLIYLVERMAMHVFCPRAVPAGD